MIKGIVDYFGTVDLLQYYIVSYEIIDDNLADTHASQIWTVQVKFIIRWHNHMPSEHITLIFRFG